MAILVQFFNEDGPLIWQTRICCITNFYGLFTKEEKEKFQLVSGDVTLRTEKKEFIDLVYKKLHEHFNLPFSVGILEHIHVMEVRGDVGNSFFPKKELW